MNITESASYFGKITSRHHKNVEEANIIDNLFLDNIPSNVVTISNNENYEKLHYVEIYSGFSQFK